MEKEKIILCYGDSLTAGYGFTQEHSYPGVLQKMFNEKGYAYQVINAGVSGETTSGGLNRLPRFLDIKADFFILELGINDGLRGQSLDIMQNNLQKIIDQVEQKMQDTRLIIAGMDLPVKIHNPYIRRFLEIYPSLAKKNNAILIPHFLEDVLGVPSLNLPDRLHPNKEGYQIIAQTVFINLLPHLDEPSV
ncbi:MAG: arylesterase [Candidatus Cyclobacteriaceae bacterium M2_1C_046]